MKDSSSRLTFGTMFDAGGLAAEAWKAHEQRFAVSGVGSGAADSYAFDRVPKKAMCQIHSLDVLLVAPPRQHHRDKHCYAN